MTSITIKGLTAPRVDFHHIIPQWPLLGCFHNLTCKVNGYSKSHAFSAPCCLCFADHLRTDCAAGALRDSDIEEGLSRLAAPVLIAAGLSPVSTKVLVVDDDHLNAFVIDRRHIFLHSGLILRSKRPKCCNPSSRMKRRISQTAILRGAVRHCSLAEMPPISARPWPLRLAASGSGEAATGIALGVRGSATRKFPSHSRAEEARQINLRLAIWCVRGSIPWGWWIHWIFLWDRKIWLSDDRTLCPVPPPNP